MALLVSSFSAMSATVKVTSFNFVRTSNDVRSPLAELCGKVEGAASSPSFIHVSVDPKSNNPASYNTLAGADGKFCIAVITYRGSADVTVMGESKAITAEIQ